MVKKKKPRKHKNLPKSVKKSPSKKEDKPLNSNNKRVEIHEKRIEKTLSFQGPLPPPDALAAYDKIVEGAAEKIIGMAVSQSEHRQYLEKKVIESDIKNSKLGLVFGLIIGLFGMGAAVYCASIDQPTVGSILGGGTLAMIVSTFVYGSQSRKKERERKRVESMSDKPRLDFK